MLANVAVSVCRPRLRLAEAGLHRFILAGVVAGALLLYGQTVARCGHTFRMTDAYMYYSHARSWYFDGDCNYENDLQIAPPAFKHRDFYLAWRTADGRVMNVFPCAWSVIALPFVALADGLTCTHNALTGAALPRDGYSAYYLALVPLAHVLLGVVGLLAGYALLARYFSKMVAAVSIAIVWCGTHVAYYVSMDPTSTHAAAMAFVTGTAWTADTIRRDGWSVRRAALLGLCCGMMVAVRYQEIAWVAVPIVLLLPRLVADVVQRRPHAGWHVALAGLAIGVAAVCFIPQLVVNLSTEGTLVGHVRTWTPHWWTPEFVRELFASRTGLFTIYPLAAFGIGGAGVCFARTRRCRLPTALLAGFALLLYINACWPWAHSPRRYVCGMLVFALGIATALEWAARSRRRSLAIALVLGVLCIVNVARLFDPATILG